MSSGLLGDPKGREQFTVEVTSTEVVGGKSVLGLGSAGMYAPPSGASGGVDAASGVTAHDAQWAWPVLAALPRSAVLAFDGTDARPFPARRAVVRAHSGRRGITPAPDKSVNSQFRELSRRFDSSCT